MLINGYVNLLKNRFATAQIDIEALYKLSILYLAEPVLLFFVLWLRLPWSILFGAMFVTACLCAMREPAGRELNCAFAEQGTQWSLTWPGVLVVFFFSLVFCYSCGIGGYTWQNDDHIARNAYFSDLIQLSWPVYSSSGEWTLIYYLCHWLLPALLTKPFYFLFGFETAWTVGKCFLLIWTAMGVCLTVCWLAYIVKISKVRWLAILCVMFMFFDSPMILKAPGTPFLLYDVYGIIYSYWYLGLPVVQAVSPLVQLGWTFNQAVPIWIVIAMLMEEKRLKNYGFLGLLCLPYAPFAMIAIAFIFSIKAIELALKAYPAKLLYIVKDVLSVQNVLALCSIFLVFGSYYLASPVEEAQFIFKLLDISLLIEFCFFSFGLYALLIFIDHRKNPVFYAVLIFMMLAPFFVVGNQALRVYYVPMFILMIYIFQFVFSNIHAGIINAVLFFLLSVPFFAMNQAFRVYYVPVYISFIYVLQYILLKKCSGVTNQENLKMRKPFFTLRSVLAALLCIVLILGFVFPISHHRSSRRYMSEGHYEFMTFTSSVNESPQNFSLTVFNVPKESFFYKYLAKNSFAWR